MSSDSSQKTMSDLREVQRRKTELETSRVNSEYEKLLRNQEEYSKIKGLNIFTLASDTIDDIIQENDKFVDGSKKRFGFIDKSLNEISPMFPENIVLIGAESGHGKSTISANLVYSIVIQRKRCLVISTEETAAAVYRRIACLHLGLRADAFSTFSEDQRSLVSRVIKNLTPFVTVVTDDSRGLSGATTSLEGVINILDQLKAEKSNLFDCIIIDYWQGITTTKTNAKAVTWEVQRMVSDYLDQFKNRYPAPIVILSQLHPQSETQQKTFEERIKGSKSIYVRSTFSVELKPNKKERSTEFVIHKSRYFNPPPNKKFKVGFEGGRFVEYTEQFQAKVRNELYVKESPKPVKPEERKNDDARPSDDRPTERTKPEVPGDKE